MIKLSNKELIKNYTNIAFCQRSFYTPAAWRRAMKCMDVLVKGGYAIPYDFGRGKGKFTTTSLGDEFGFADLWVLVQSSGLVIKPIKEN